MTVQVVKSALGNDLGFGSSSVVCDLHGNAVPLVLRRDMYCRCSGMTHAVCQAFPHGKNHYTPELFLLRQFSVQIYFYADCLGILQESVQLAVPPRIGIIVFYGADSPAEHIYGSCLFLCPVVVKNVPYGDQSRSHIVMQLRLGGQHFLFSCQNQRIVGKPF